METGHLQVNRDAPVVVASAIEVAAPVEVVWRVLTDLENWPRWNSAVASIAVDGPVAAGTTFRWKAGPGTITSTLLEVASPTAIAWTGRTLGLRAIHVFALHAVDEQTVVRTEESYSGVIASFARRALRRALARALDQGLVDLKTAARAASLTQSA